MQRHSEVQLMNLVGFDIGSLLIHDIIIQSYTCIPGREVRHLSKGMRDFLPPPLH